MRAVLARARTPRQAHSSHRIVLHDARRCESGYHSLRVGPARDRRACIPDDHGVGRQRREHRANPPEATPDQYPESNMFGDLPAWGYYLRHVTGVTFTNCTSTAAASDTRPKLVTMT
jgi:hypothetical protein